MLNRKILLASVLLGILVALGACSSEPKADKALVQAEAAVAAGNLEGAVPLFEALLADYPKSKAAVKGEAELKAIRQTLAGEKAEMEKVLTSVRDVLEGYRAMYGRYPGSLADLDNGEYFFDGDYLAGIVPKGDRVYLLFADAPPYRIWGFSAKRENGVYLDPAAEEPRGAARAEALKALEASGPAVAEIGALAAYGKGGAGKAL